MEEKRVTDHMLRFDNTSNNKNETIELEVKKSRSESGSGTFKTNLFTVDHRFCNVEPSLVREVNVEEISSYNTNQTSDTLQEFDSDRIIENHGVIELCTDYLSGLNSSLDDISSDIKNRKLEEMNSLSGVSDIDVNMLTVRESYIRLVNNIKYECEHILQLLDTDNCRGFFSIYEASVNGVITKCDRLNKELYLMVASTVSTRERILDRREEIAIAAKPLVELLNSYKDLQASITITPMDIEVVSGKLRIYFPTDYDVTK